MSDKLRTPRLRELGIAGGLLAIVLFGILYGITGHPAAAIVGCGGGLTLLIASVSGRSAPTHPKI